MPIGEELSVTVITRAEVRAAIPRIAIRIRTATVLQSGRGGFQNGASLT
jgi:hypothetical protein